MNKHYAELIGLKTFTERFDYLRLNKQVGDNTFGFYRCFNQAFYRSRQWKNIRQHVIIRDNGCDLGIVGRAIHNKIIVHHINPITIKDIEKCNDCLLDINNLICVTDNTHNAIHFGNKSTLIKPFEERKKGDTCPWVVY